MGQIPGQLGPRVSECPEASREEKGTPTCAHRHWHIPQAPDTEASEPLKYTSLALHTVEWLHMWREPAHGFSRGLSAPCIGQGQQPCFSIHGPNQKESLREAPGPQRQRQPREMYKGGD